MSYVSKSCHIGWASCRRENRACGVGLCCAASVSSAMGQSQLPFGGAIVAKLAGSGKILRGEHQIVPLLGPGRATGQSELPFGASLECVRRSSFDEQRGPEVAPVRSISYRFGATTDDETSSSSRMLDVHYVLAGTGFMTTADGAVRSVNAGDSLIAWHNTTTLRSIDNDQPPAVLKFHFPASVLMLPPGTVVAPAPSHADLQILVDEGQGDYDGELSPQEAANMLSGVQQRASRAITQIYNNHQKPRSSILSSTPRFVARLLRQATAPVASAAQLLLGSALVSRDRAVDRAPAAATPTTAAAATAATLAVADAAAAAHQSQEPSGGLSGRQQQPAPASDPGSCDFLAAALQDRNGQSPSGCVLLQRALEEFKTFRFPRQTNRLAFLFDPSELGLSLSFGVEVFEPGHHTPPHIHKSAHELFFVLAGEGVAFCNGQRFPVGGGDCVVFPPRAVHGIDNTSATDKLYCLQLMTPNEEFVEHVKSGEAVGRLDDEDLCHLTSRRC